MEFDAIILAGGRSSRLGGVPKSGLIYDGATLLERSLRAAGAAGRTVVVGPDPGDLPGGVLTCREDPPFAGPAAAIAAGLAALAADHASRHEQPRPRRIPSSWPVTCPARPARSVPWPRRWPRLLQARRNRGWGRRRHGRLGRRPEAAARGVLWHGRATTLLSRTPRAGAGLENASVFALLARLDVREVRVPPGSTDDVDTWDDASALGVSGRIPDRGPGSGPELRS